MDRHPRVLLNHMHMCHLVPPAFQSADPFTSHSPVTGGRARRWGGSPTF